MNALNAVKRRAVNALQLVKDRAFAKRSATAVAMVSAAVLAGPAHAQTTTFTLDTSTVVSTIAAAVTALSSIGLAVLSLVVIIKIFKWAQRTL